MLRAEEISRMLFSGRDALIVDDDGSLRLSLRMRLEYWGFGVETASNGEEAVDKYCKTRPEIVIMDLQMPVMDGYDASRAILALNPRAKILLVTGAPDTPLSRKALTTRSVRGVLPKPFDADQLKIAIEGIL